MRRREDREDELEDDDDDEDEDELDEKDDELELLHDDDESDDHEDEDDDEEEEERRLRRDLWRPMDGAHAGRSAFFFFPFGFRLDADAVECTAASTVRTGVNQWATKGGCAR